MIFWASGNENDVFPDSLFLSALSQIPMLSAIVVFLIPLRAISPTRTG
nr:MAG TPA: hypothetical protein [Caudoviricetes sp.]